VRICLSSPAGPGAENLPLCADLTPEERLHTIAVSPEAFAKPAIVESAMVRTDHPGDWTIPGMLAGGAALASEFGPATVGIVLRLGACGVAGLALGVGLALLTKDDDPEAPATKRTQVGPTGLNGEVEIPIGMIDLDGGPPTGFLPQGGANKRDGTGSIAFDALPMTATASAGPTTRAGRPGDVTRETIFDILMYPPSDDGDGMVDKLYTDAQGRRAPDELDDMYQDLIDGLGRVAADPNQPAQERQIAGAYRDALQGALDRGVEPNNMQRIHRQLGSAGFPNPYQLEQHLNGAPRDATDRARLNDAKDAIDRGQDVNRRYSVHRSTQAVDDIARDLIQRIDDCLARPDDPGRQDIPAGTPFGGTVQPFDELVRSARGAAGPVPHATGPAAGTSAPTGSAPAVQPVAAPTGAPSCSDQLEARMLRHLAKQLGLKPDDPKVKQDYDNRVRQLQNGMRSSGANDDWERFAERQLSPGQSPEVLFDWYRAP
jgi:hypothetical protein